MSPAAGPVIAFDLDGTLIDTAPDLIGTLGRILTANGYPTLPDEAVRPTIGHGAKAMIEKTLALQAIAVSDDAVRDLHKAFLTDYAANIAVESRPFPGLLESLDLLASKGCTLAVCTNKMEGLSRQLLEELSLTDRFAAICGADTFPRRKPDPLHLIKTVETAGGAPERAIMVGDSNTDITTAKRAGIPVVAVDFGYTEVPVSELGPDVVISHYDQLVDAIETIAPGMLPAA